MKKISLAIVFLLLSSCTFTAKAQVTAVMQAKVKIVSGAGLTAIQSSSIDLASLDTYTTSDVEAGEFSLVAAPGTDVNVVISQDADIINAEGDSIEFDSFSIDKNSNESGNHHIKVNGKLNTQNQVFSGHYEGAITAVVEYL